MFAIIQNQQRLARTQVVGQAFEQGTRRVFAQAQHRSQGARYQLRVGHRRQFQQPGAIGISFQKFHGGLQGQTGLAGATRAGQRH